MEEVMQECEKKFNSEEANGKYLDLNSIYLQFKNIKKVHSFTNSFILAFFLPYSIVKEAELAEGRWLLDLAAKFWESRIDPALYQALLPKVLPLHSEFGPILGELYQTNPAS